MQGMSCVCHRSCRCARAFIRRLFVVLLYLSKLCKHGLFPNIFLPFSYFGSLAHDNNTGCHPRGRVLPTTHIVVVFMLSLMYHR